MDKMEYDLVILQQMAKNEEKLSELYGFFMRKFPTRKDFWMDIAQEEVGHARWIKILTERVKEGKVEFSEQRFNIDILNDFYSQIQQQLLRAEDNMPLITALVVSKEVEETMLEKNFFEVFKGDAPELEVLLLALKYSTEKHREIVQNAWEEERALLSQ